MLRQPGADQLKGALELRAQGSGFIVLLKQIEYGVYGDLIIIYPKPYSIYLRGTIEFRVMACGEIMLGPLAYPNVGDSCRVSKNQDRPCSL